MGGRWQRVVAEAGRFLAVGGVAYALGLYIVRPLERLAEGAAEVANGDLQVDLPSTSGGEVFASGDGSQSWAARHLPDGATQVYAMACA